MPKRINSVTGKLIPNVTIEFTYIEIPKSDIKSDFNEYLVNSQVADYIEKLENEILNNEKIIAHLLKTK